MHGYPAVFDPHNTPYQARSNCIFAFRDGHRALIHSLQLAQMHAVLCWRRGLQRRGLHERVIVRALLAKARVADARGLRADEGIQGDAPRRARGRAPAAGRRVLTGAWALAACLYASARHVRRPGRRADLEACVNGLHERLIVRALVPKARGVGPGSEQDEQKGPHLRHVFVRDGAWCARGT